MAIIYVVDDDPLLLDLISSVLRTAGHQVVTSSDPVASLEAISGADPPIDLLLTEAGMYPFSGLKLVNYLRTQRIECPVIFMTWHQGIAAAITDSVGRRAVMEKPFTADQLRKAVQRSLAGNKVIRNRAS
jgi:DNA-binding NtrC family response regulator